MEKKLPEKWYSRKLLLFVFVTLMLTIGLFLGKVSGAEYTAGISSSYLLYVVGNGVDKYNAKE